jgi:Outer membrane efflux protein
MGFILMRKKKKLIFVLLAVIVSIRAYPQQKNISFFTTHSIATNPQLYQFQNQLLSNRVDSELIAAQNTFQVTGNSFDYYSPVINGYGYDAVITNGQQLAALVSVTKPINTRKNLEVAFRNLQLERDSLNITSDITKKDIRKSVIAQYIVAYGDQLQIGISNEIINLLANEEKILKKLTQNNVYKQADYLSFLVTLQQQELSRSQFLLQYKNDYSTLNLLAGIVDTTLDSLAPPDIYLAQKIDMDTSAFFLKFINDSLRLINHKQQISVGYRPKISLFADAGYQSSLTLTPYKNFGPNVGISLSVPIYDGHQKQLQYTKVNIEERTRQRQKDYFGTQLEQQVRLLLQQLEELESLSQPIENQIKYLETLISVNGKLLETGDIKITDYVLAINNYITSRNLIIQNKMARYQIINQLNYWNSNL